MVREGRSGSGWGGEKRLVVGAGNGVIGEGYDEGADVLNKWYAGYIWFGI